MSKPQNPSLLPPPPPTPPTPPVQAPRTRADLDALGAKRGELKSQLDALTERRRELVEQSLLARDAARGELNARIKTLDDRSARIEREILQADDAIAAGLARGVMTEPPRQQVATVPPREPDIGISMERAFLFEVLPFVLVGFAFWQFGFKRALAKLSRPGQDQSGRLDQLQQAVDVIAVEVERISEGQRYVTKVLNEQLQLGAGEAQGVPMKHKSAAPVRASEE
jgi:hypothetical protein